jgi:hypothetical protein
MAGVSNLSPWQQFLSSKAPGKNASFSDQQLRQWADEFFGPIPIPPGSQIVRQDGGYAEWIDPEGYKHSATRSLDGRDPNAGKLVDNTDRPNILPASQTASPQQQALTSGIGALTEEQIKNLQAMASGNTPGAFDPKIQDELKQINDLALRLQNAPQLLDLDPASAAALEAIRNRYTQANQQQFQNDQGKLLAQLFGNKVNQSSIATGAAGDLLQKQGLITAQTGADAAQRELAVRQFLAQQQQQQLELALQSLLGGTGAKLEGFKASSGAAQNQNDALLKLLADLGAQQTTRDIAGANIGLGEKELAERARQANLGFELNQQDADARLAAQNSTWNKVMQGINAASQIAGMVGGGLGAFGGFLNKPKVDGTSQAQKQYVA